MLVLSRLRDETIMIGDDIELTVVDIRGDKVRLGIKAPTSVPVHRKEVYEEIKRENEKAARVRGEELVAMRPGGLPPDGSGSIQPRGKQVSMVATTKLNRASSATPRQTA